MVVYSLDIFRRANVQLNNYILTILVQSGFVLGYIISGCLLSHVKRKVHFTCGALLMAISQAILGLTLKANVKAVLIFCNFRTLECDAKKVDRQIL